MQVNTALEQRSDLIRSLLQSLLFALLLMLALSLRAQGQGSIFGTVTNSDNSTPAVGEISFFGYIGGTDNELRVESVVGAGYDAGNWFDDFQNYQDEAPGLPYAYHFFNLNNGESAILSGLIPNNSFQQENVALSASAWPDAPEGLQVSARSESSLTLSWSALPGLSYHLYRRAASSDGSFFRIDEPGGSLDNPGIAGDEYVDGNISAGVEYEYLLIAEDALGILGIHSEVLDTGAPTYVCGDADSDGIVNISDAIFIIQYIFAGGPAPDPLASADVDCSAMVNISDAVFLIQYIFNSGPAPCDACP